MTEPQHDEGALVESGRRATTPIAGSIAGILFAILFGTSVLIIRMSVVDLAANPGTWVETGEPKLRFAVTLIPFAGLFFLWFIAVARERLGRHEDQFFATVFLGSGLLFIAMMFAAAASAGAVVAAIGKASSSSAGFATSTTYVFARGFIAQIFNVYAIRMAAVFLASQATLWLRTSVMPRWMTYITYVVALVLLFVATQAYWVILVFPAWVFLVSCYILVTRLRRVAGR
jgi:hypothetical protein